MAIANTLPYYDMATLTAVKSFLPQPLGWKRMAVASILAYHNTANIIAL
jgi:hypothetical protein